MIRLTLLGGIDLVSPDSGITQQVLQQPKRLAVLAYIALAGPGAFRSRDTALALFWPDSTEDRARQSLSQTVHFLRRSLGHDVIRSRGPGELGVCTDALWCDVIAFDQALKSGNPEEALRLYAGDLLSGFFIGASPEFEQWLDGERAHLRQSASTAAWKLARSAERDSRFTKAAAWAHRAVELSSNDEGSLQNLLRMLERMGDRAGALKAYDTFARRLVAEFGARPSAETMQIATRLRSQSESQPIAGGVSPAATGGVSGIDQSLQKDIQPGRSDPSSGEKQPDIALAAELQPVTSARATSRLRWLQGASLVLAVAALCGLGFLGLYGKAYALHGEHASHGHPRVVIDTLADLGGRPGSTSIGRALTAGIIDRMVQVQSFDVSSGPAISPSGGAESSLLLDPQLSVTGSVLESDGRVRVNVQISDAVTGRTIKTAVLDHPTGSMLPLVDALALQISTLVRTVVGHEVQLRAWSAGARSKEVYELMQKADEDADRASQLDRSGDLSASARALESADATLRDAERIAPDWGEPMLGRAKLANRLAVAYLIPPLRDPARAKAVLELGIREAAHAVALDRSDAWAQESLGTLSYWYWLVVPLPQDSARRIQAKAEWHLRNSTLAGPGHASALSLLSASLYSRADYAGAYATANQAYQEDAYLANTQQILNMVFITAYEIGDDSASTRWCDETNRRFEQSWTSAYCQLSLLERGDATDERAIARAWKIAAEVGPSSGHGHTADPDLQMLVAAVLARHGLRDSAEAVIHRTREQGTANPEMLPYEAEARILLGQPDVAVALLKQYSTAVPLHSGGVLRSRRFVSLAALQRNLVSPNSPEKRR